MRHPVIVLEGADGAGKTTLARALVEVAGGRYLHMTYNRYWAERMHAYELGAARLAWRWSRECPVVIDRWWQSDLVYGSEFRDGPSFPHQARMFGRVADAVGLTTVYCCPSDREAQSERHGKRAGEGGEMYDALGTLPERYLELYGRELHREGVALYDMDRYLGRVHDAAEALFAFACDHASDPLARSCAEDLAPGSLSGNIRGEVLVVGDLRTSPAHVWPMAVPSQANDKLSVALDQAGVDDHRLCFLDVGRAGVSWSWLASGKQLVVLAATEDDRVGHMAAYESGANRVCDGLSVVYMDQGRGFSQSVAEAFSRARR